MNEYRVRSEIWGGVTGRRSAYLKSAGRELRFKTRAEAEAYIEECKKNWSPFRNFNQIYEVEIV